MGGKIAICNKTTNRNLAEKKFLMEFWIYMLIMDLLLPFTMIGFGRYFMKKAPKEINAMFGYWISDIHVYEK